MTYLIKRLNEIMGHCLICDDTIYVQGYEGFDISATPIIVWILCSFYSPTSAQKELANLM